MIVRRLRASAMPAGVDKSTPANTTAPDAASGLRGTGSPAGAKVGVAARSAADNSNTLRDMWPPQRLRAKNWLIHPIDRFSGVRSAMQERCGCEVDAIQ